MTRDELASACTERLTKGLKIMLTLPPGARWPKGWPRGEMANETERGRVCYFDPLKILAWIQRAARAENEQENEQERQRWKRSTETLDNQ